MSYRMRARGELFARRVIVTVPPVAAPFLLFGIGAAMLFDLPTLTSVLAFMVTLAALVIVIAAKREVSRLRDVVGHISRMVDVTDSDLPETVNLNHEIDNVPPDIVRLH